MPRYLAAAVCLALALAGCKIVPNAQGGDAAATQDDASLMAAKVQSVWTPKVLPYIAENAKNLDTVVAALKDGVDVAGAKYGRKAADLGAGWNFVVQGKGTIVAANLESRAAKLDVDTTGDGQANVTIQIGPIVNGTALRDALPFVQFTDYRDQIQFAKLARALNDMAVKAFPRPTGKPVGDTVTFTGVFSYAGDGQQISLVPTALTLGPK